MHHSPSRDYVGKVFEVTWQKNPQIAQPDSVIARAPGSYRICFPDPGADQAYPRPGEVWQAKVTMFTKHGVLYLTKVG